MSGIAVERIDADKVGEVFGAHCIDLISAGLGGKVIAFSDEWFAPAENLLTVAAPIRRPGVFVHTGAWYDGWETRRHNSEPADWVVVKLGVSSGRVFGFEIDTAFFSGNHAPEVSVEGIFLSTGDHPSATDKGWETILPVQPCGPSQRHIFKLEVPTSKAFSHVKLNMIPDGGIARFRLFGQAVPVFPADLETIIDLAHVANGGLAIKCSDQHFGKKDNLLNPNRGADMGDGWETARSRERGHEDWVIVQLGAPGRITSITIDTAHFRGNFPQKVAIHGISLPLVSAETAPSVTNPNWVPLVHPTACKADHEHHFISDDDSGIIDKLSATGKLEEAALGLIITHVKMTIIPDGGVSRLRVYGRRAGPVSGDMIEV